jgi:hypothetical protein
MKILMDSRDVVAASSKLNHVSALKATTPTFSLSQLK